MCMYKIAIIRYKSSLNDKYVTWNICFENINQTIREKSFSMSKTITGIILGGDLRLADN